MGGGGGFIGFTLFYVFGSYDLGVTVCVFRDSKVNHLIVSYHRRFQGAIIIYMY